MPRGDRSPPPAGPLPAGEPAVPGVVRAAALLVAVEAVTLLVLAVFEALTALTGDSTAEGGLVTAAFSAVGGVLLLLLARALGRGRPAARSPAVVIQLLMLPIGINLIGPSGRPEWGIPAIALAVVTLGLLFSPAASTTLHRDLPRE